MLVWRAPLGCFLRLQLAAASSEWMHGRVAHDFGAARARFSQRFCTESLRLWSSVLAAMDGEIPGVRA